MKGFDYKSRQQVRATAAGILAAISRASNRKRPNAVQGNNDLTLLVLAFRFESSRACKMRKDDAVDLTRTVEMTIGKELLSRDVVLQVPFSS